MIPLEKLAKLSPRHRLRKTALVLEAAERQLLADPSAAATLAGYLRGLAGLLGADAASAESPQRLAGSAEALEHAAAAGEPSGALVRAVDALRHAALAETGQAPADWDLIDPGTGRRDAGRRLVRPGLRVYVEDLRSPFNMGAIFRSAEAFGVEEILLSPLAADPRHPRALRSAMGAVELVPWRRAGLDALEGSGEVFALELGGSSIGSFPFPHRGTVVVGSEELGVSPEALRRCSLGPVSIPMRGAKASLNAAVAFGILLYAWDASLGGL
ncbi:MAG TPA: TrmH family RNA methyltransferase [Rectinemataceae bacterium]|nr:TrmH family RNA methyltransferase [Rectinemataceae bacterium]